MSIVELVTSPYASVRLSCGRFAPESVEMVLDNPVQPESPKSRAKRSLEIFMSSPPLAPCPVGQARPGPWLMRTTPDGPASGRPVRYGFSIGRPSILRPPHEVTGMLDPGLLKPHQGGYSAHRIYRRLFLIS